MIYNDFVFLCLLKQNLQQMKDFLSIIFKIYLITYEMMIYQLIINL